MPNHIINKLYAAPVVLDSLRGDDAEVDFTKVIPYPPGLYLGDDTGGINSLSVDCAEKAFNEPLDDHPLIARLEASNKARWSASDLDDRGFEQFIDMLRSKRQSGFYHIMDFTTAKWGTKWGAYSTKRFHDHVEFQTAWATPKPVFLALSEKFPERGLKIDFADEDRGSNCGSLLYSGGRLLEETKGTLQFAHDLWGDDEELRREYAEEMEA